MSGRRRLPALPATASTEPWQRKIQHTPRPEDYSTLAVWTEARIALVIGHPWPRWGDILRADPCAYCGNVVGGTVDHVIPLIRGEPASTLLNGGGCCKGCNGDKADKHMLIWMLQSRRLRKRSEQVRQSLRRR